MPGFTGTAISVDTIGLGGRQESMVAHLTKGTQSMRAVITESEEDLC